MNLYEIDSALQAVIDGCAVIDEETGEVIFDSSNLDELKMKLEEKLEGIGCVIKNLDAQIYALRAEELALANRRSSIQKRLDWLKKYAANYLNDNGGKFESARCSLSVRHSKAVLIEDEDKLPDKYVRRYQAQVVDKKALMNVLKQGIAVDGASLEERVNLTVK